MTYQENNSDDFIVFCEQTLESCEPKTIGAYATRSFLDAAKTYGNYSIGEEMLRYWVASMFINGMKYTTVKKYFGRVHSIYSQWNTTDGADPFDSVFPLIDTRYQVNAQEAENNCNLTKRLLAQNEQSPQWQVTAIFLYLLYDVRVPVGEVIELRFDSVGDYCPQINDIINSQPSGFGRKYLFNLSQGRLQPRSIATKLMHDMVQTLKSVGMTFAEGFSREAITAMWVAAAINRGEDIRDIRSLLCKVPAQYAALEILPPRDIPVQKQDDMICRVANQINDNASRWFVMKLRTKVSVDDIKKRIASSLPGYLKSMMLFYPTRTVVRKEGKVNIKEELPLLPELLFFKTKRHRVKPMFNAIGDLAWCFKASNTPDSDYSVISNRDMTNFQQCVGQFSSDIRMELVDTDRIYTKGRMVKIVGGIMAGYEGEILDVDDDPETKILSLKITNAQRAQWKVKVEDIFIEPLETPTM